MGMLILGAGYSSNAIPEGVIIEIEVDSCIWELEHKDAQFTWKKDGEGQFFTNFDSIIDAIHHFNEWQKEKETPTFMVMEEMISHTVDMVDMYEEFEDCNDDEYARGMYNGMELIIATMQNREPVFKPPKEKE